MSDFNRHSQRLTSLAFWRPIKPDSSPLSFAEGMQKAGKKQRSGMQKWSMMESVNSPNGSLSPSCLVHFISWRSWWQKVYWTILSLHTNYYFFVGKGLCKDRAWLSVKFGPGLPKWKEPYLSKVLGLLFRWEHPFLLHISCSFFTFPLVITIMLGNSILLQGSWQPLRMKNTI